MRLDSKVAIITGGGKGLGKAIALAFAREGADVVVAARSTSALRAVASEIEAMGRQALAVTTDLCDPRQSLAMVDKALQKFRKIDVLVNNSGIEGPTASVADMDLGAWGEVLAVNLTGAMLCAKHVLSKSMVSSRSGAIINISSGMGRRGTSMRSPYTASKWGIIGFTQSLAWETGKLGIRVNCIAPGPIVGDRIDRVLVERSRVSGVPLDEVVQSVLARSPMGRLVKPEEVAALAVFLASDESSGITGQTINCCAGAWMS